MKIGIDITPVIYQGTGVAVYTRELVRHLLPLAKQDHFVLFASTLRGQPELWRYLETLSQFANFTPKIMPVPPLLTEFVWNRLHRFPLESFVGPVDVFHAWDWQQPPAKTAKLVTTVHDLTPLKFPSDHRSHTNSVQRRRLRWVCQETAAIITDSQAAKDDLIALLGVSPALIHPVHLAPGPEFPALARLPSRILNLTLAAVRRKYQLPRDFILAVGTRQPRKNLNRLITAFNLLSDLGLDLVIAGQAGWGSRLAIPPFAKGGTKVLGLVNQEDLPALYAAAAVFVYPSLYEGFGLPVVEAMSLGCPVVTSARGSLPEIAGDAAVFVNPLEPGSIAAGIRSALSDKQQLTARGLRRVRSFSWAKTAALTLKVYRYANRH